MPGDARPDLARLGWKALLEPSVERIAIANPEHAPYGRAAVTALRGAGIYEQVRAKLSTVKYRASGAVRRVGQRPSGNSRLIPGGFPPMRNGKRWQIPANMHAPIEQGAVILKSAKDKEGARASWLS